MSEPNELTRALSLLQSRCGGMAKSGRNSHLRSEYSTLKDAWAVVRPHLAELGLSITQWPVCEDGKAGARTEVEHVSGLGKECTLLLPIPKGNNAIHAIGSAVTYARRFTLLAACGLAEDEHDDDGNAAGNMAGGNAERRPQPLPVGPRKPPAGAQPPPPEVLDDLHAHILRLIPSLPEETETRVETDAKAAREAGDFGGLREILTWVQGVLKEGVAG